MKRRLTCTGCSRKIGPNDDGINMTFHGDDGVDTEVTICLPCGAKIIRDPEFAKRFDEKAALVKGSIKA